MAPLSHNIPIVKAIKKNNIAKKNRKLSQKYKK